LKSLRADARRASADPLSRVSEMWPPAMRARGAHHREQHIGGLVGDRVGSEPLMVRPLTVAKVRIPMRWW